jgi:hypothetical protein
VLSNAFHITRKYWLAMVVIDFFTMMLLLCHAPLKQILVMVSALAWKMVLHYIEKSCVRIEKYYVHEKFVS